MEGKKKYQIQMVVTLRPLGENGTPIYSGMTGASALEFSHHGIVEIGTLMEGAALIDEFDRMLQSKVEPGSLNLGKNYQ